MNGKNFFHRNEQSYEDWINDLGIDSEVYGSVYPTHACWLDGTMLVVAFNAESEHMLRPHVGIKQGNSEWDAIHLPINREGGEVDVDVRDGAITVQQDDIEYRVRVEDAQLWLVRHEGAPESKVQELEIKLDMHYDRNQKICRICNSTRHKSLIGDDDICDTCRPDLITCDECDQDEVLSTHSADVVAGMVVCDDCLADEFEECCHCNTYEYSPDVYHTSYGTLCDLCYHDSFTRCCDCGTTTHNDYVYGGACESCRRVIRPYSRTEVREYLPHRGEGLYLGVELEVECPLGNRNDVAYDINQFDHIELKSDSSLRDGFEIVTQPATLDYHLEHMKWSNILRTLRDYGAESEESGRCGLHIHMSRDVISEWTQIRFAYFMNEIESFVTKLARRGYNSYARKEDKSLMLGDNMSGGRHACTNFGHSNTIEVRLFKGTLDDLTFFATLEFVVALKEFCDDTPTEVFTDHDAVLGAFAEYVEDNYDTLFEYLKQNDLV